MEKETFRPRGNIAGPILPRYALTLKISLGAKMLYSLLCDYAGDKDHCWPSQTTLAGLLGCSVSSIKTYLRELAGQRLIAVELRECRSSTYYLLKPSFLSARAGQSNSDGGQADSGYRSNYRKKETNYPPTPKPQAAKEPPVTRQPRRGVGDFFSANDAFEKFCALYPRKEAKELARSVWHRLWRRGQLPGLDVLIAALDKFKASAVWLKEHGRFVPQLVNWLKGQRWLDEAPENAGETLSPTDQAKHEELRRLKEAFAEQEKRRTERAQAEAARLRPAFDAFLARFADGEKMRGPAWGLWCLLQRKGKAPLAVHVTDPGVGVLTFLRNCSRVCKKHRIRIHDNERR